MAVTLCALLWAREGCDAALIEYEDQVLRLVPEHGGRVILRARSSGTGADPLEVHLLEFRSESALQQYLDDDRRKTLAESGGQAIARSDVFRVEPA